MKRNLIQAAALFIISIICVRAGIFFGKSWIAEGAGIKNAVGYDFNLFRFDSEYYYSIATDGYAYNGDPYSSPNIVFAPLYPALIWLLSFIPGLDEILAGFIINEIFLFGALCLLLNFLRPKVGDRVAFFSLLAMMTSAGSYAFHAYYSESTMLFFLALLLHQVDKQKPISAALAACALGGARVSALPIALVSSLYFILQAARDSKDRTRNMIAALICPLGALLFLGYIGFHFGNPLWLFPEIQGASWSFFHPDVPFYFFLGPNLILFSISALSKGLDALLDIKALNLLWTILAFSSLVYRWRQGSRDFLLAVFAAYFAFIYATGAGSEFLISAHRFYALMLPIFLAGANRCEMFLAKSRIFGLLFSGLLILINLAYSLFHTANFNQGIWYYF